MYHDLKWQLFYRMVSTGFHLGTLPEGSEFAIGQVTVPSAGTAVQLKPSAGALPLRAGVFIRLNNFDTGSDVAYVGVSDGVSETTGFMVDKYYPCWLEIDDLSDVWVDANNNDVGVSYMAV